ncbi:MAG: hypothetical protein ABIF71_13175 [Planctomycetota bacterium]
MPNEKITCLGAGSFYFVRALADLPMEPGLEGSEIVLYDIAPEKTRRMTAMGRRLATAAGTGFRVRAAKSLADAVDGASFALSSIGGSGASIGGNVSTSYYHSMDVHIAAKYGIQQVVGDTAGPGGMMMGLRSVPAHMTMCREMEKRCPKVIFFNHSNPMAVLMRAIHKYSSINAIGICHGVQGGIMRLAHALGVDPHTLECRWIGTNHYYWFTEVLHEGKDILPKIFRMMRGKAAPEEQAMCWELSNIYGYRLVYPKDDHAIEFYPFLAQVKRQADLPYRALIKGARSHGITGRPKLPRRPKVTAAARAAFFKEYQAVLDKTELPETRGDGITGEGIASFMSAIANRRKEHFIVNIANRGAVPNLPAHAEVEVEAVTCSRGVRPMVMGDCPPVLKAMLEKRFAWQECVADAAVTGDRQAALQALMLDEMAIWPRKSAAMLDELLAGSRDLLPQFFRR